MLFKKISFPISHVLRHYDIGQYFSLSVPVPQANIIRQLKHCLVRRFTFKTQNGWPVREKTGLLKPGKQWVMILFHPHLFALMEAVNEHRMLLSPKSKPWTTCSVLLQLKPWKSSMVHSPQYYGSTVVFTSSIHHLRTVMCLIYWIILLI